MERPNIPLDHAALRLRDSARLLVGKTFGDVFKDKPTDPIVNEILGRTFYEAKAAYCEEHNLGEDKIKFAGAIVSKYTITKEMANSAVADMFEELQENGLLA